MSLPTKHRKREEQMHQWRNVYKSETQTHLKRKKPTTLKSSLVTVKGANSKSSSAIYKIRDCICSADMAEQRTKTIKWKLCFSFRGCPLKERGLTKRTLGSRKQHNQEESNSTEWFREWFSYYCQVLKVNGTVGLAKRIFNEYQVSQVGDCP